MRRSSRVLVLLSATGLSVTGFSVSVPQLNKARCYLLFIVSGTLSEVQRMLASLDALEDAQQGIYYYHIHSELRWYRCGTHAS